MTAPLDLIAIRMRKERGWLSAWDAIPLLAEVERLRAENERLQRGKADWLYDHEWEMHIPGCSQPKGRWRCGNGPLTGDAIATGDCGEAHDEALRADSVPRSALVAVLAELDAEHRPEPDRPWGCVMCWPRDGSWPCVTRLIADELRAIVEREGGDE